MLARNSVGPTKLGTAVVLIVGLSLLTGCDQIYPDEAPLRLQEADKTLRLAVCVPAGVNYVLLEARGTDDPSWTKVWEASGEVQIVAGSVLESSSAPPGMEATVWTELSGSVGDTIAVTLTGEDETLLAEFVIPEDGLPDKQWLELDGELFDKPCG